MVKESEWQAIAETRGIPSGDRDALRHTGSTGHNGTSIYYGNAADSVAQSDYTHDYTAWRT